MDDNLASHTKRFIARSVPRVVIAPGHIRIFSTIKPVYNTVKPVYSTVKPAYITTRVVALKRIILPILMEQP